MAGLSRADNSTLGRWFWTVDRWTLGAIVALIFCGYVMMLAASPAVAERIHAPRDSFIYKQVCFLILGGIIVFGISMLSPRGVRRLALAGCLIALALTALTLVSGTEIKGARRWVSIPGMSIQPSEFLKPCFAVITAFLLDEARKARANGKYFPGGIIAIGSFGLIALLLQSQPDIGMLAVVTAVFFTQLFINGLNIVLTVIGAFGIGGAGFAAYTLFPHVHTRVEKFLHPEAKDNYQVERALEAFSSGGLLGRGAGEGFVKNVLPDAHADFVFAVAGEEFGMVLCVALMGIFAFIVLRSMFKAMTMKDTDMFIILATAGLVTSFGLQAFVNMGSALHLIPTKGMTLPFISYGGSSVLAVALTMGMLLALTRRRNAGEGEVL